MHPFVQAELAVLHQNDLLEEAQAGRRRSEAVHARSDRAGHAPPDVVIRRSTSGDGPALAALSALDAAPTPLGPALVAEVSGALRAVLPLDGGRGFGDPFHRTDELIALLELRAAQLRSAREQERRHRGVLAWMSPAALRRHA